MCVLYVIPAAWRQWTSPAALSAAAKSCSSLWGELMLLSIFIFKNDLLSFFLPSYSGDAIYEIFDIETPMHILRIYTIQLCRNIFIHCIWTLFMSITKLIEDVRNCLSCFKYNQQSAPIASDNYSIRFIENKVLSK